MDENYIITIEFTPFDAHRLLWLLQREVSMGKVWRDYWLKIAQHVEANINCDMPAEKLEAANGTQVHH